MTALFRNQFLSESFFQNARLHFAVPFSKSSTSLGEPSMKSQDIFVCPMHPEVRKNDPSACPKCGMALELIPPSLEDGENPDRLDEKIHDSKSS
jgi:Heavy metal binding domain